MSGKIITIGGVEFDLQIIIVIIIGTVIPMLDWYGHNLTGTKAYDRIIWYFIIPMLTIVLLFREPVADFGFQIGNWRVGVVWTAVVCVVMAVILYFVARTPAMQSYYQARAPESVIRLIYITGVDLFGWEFLWRGFMLFAFARAFGPGAAILLQAVPFALLHLGKPETETLTTLFGGVGFGFIAWQSQSFVYPFLIHWFIASFTMLIASGKIF
ncbi:MAG: CPBP family intramembrane metalloprotease [Chloroflexi bacterium]|nr:CPBP family intramembrane metalloprotease [Chloroflexota bacterium]